MLNQVFIYKTLGSTVELVCPIVNTTRAITWFGPLNYKVYAVGTLLSTDVSTQVDIHETASDKKSVLLIHRFTKDKRGNFRCSNTFEEREFILMIKSKI